MAKCHPGCHTGKACRFISMLFLTGGFFIVEIVVGYVVNSIALVADSFHMLSDVVALVVGFASIRVSKLDSKKNTFGWQRAEVLGALVNAVFLIALCFSIFVESLQRLIQIEKVEDPKLMLIVGGLGLLVNVIGLFLFGHGHSHGGGGDHGHGHSHGGHGHSHDDTDGHDQDESAELQNLTDGQDSKIDVTMEKDVALQIATIDPSSSSSDTETTDEGGKKKKKKKKLSSSQQLNMRGVFLHVLGDALGSVIVCISALIIWFVEDDWKYYMDPVMSIILVIIILSTTVPLLKESAFILLQTVPTHIQVTELEKKLLQKVEGVVGIHEFHVWQLAGQRIVASAHVRISSLSEYVRVAQEIKTIFHNEGIHSLTIQPEFTQLHETDKEGRDCALECGPDKACYTDTCCGPKKLRASVRKDKDNGNGIRFRPTSNGDAETVPSADVSEPVLEAYGHV